MSSVNGPAEPSDFVVKLHEASRNAQLYMLPAIPAGFLVMKVGQVAHAKLLTRLNIQDMGREDILRNAVILAAGSSLYFYWPSLLSLAEKVPFIKNWKQPTPAVDKKATGDDKKPDAKNPEKPEAGDQAAPSKSDVQVVHPGHFMVTLLCRFTMLSTAFGAPVAIAQIEDRNYRLLTCGLVGLTHFAIYRMTPEKVPVKKETRSRTRAKTAATGTEKVL